MENLEPPRLAGVTNARKGKAVFAGHLNQSVVANTQPQVPEFFLTRTVGGDHMQFEARIIASRNILESIVLDS